jgi:hypothetical protein
MASVAWMGAAGILGLIAIAVVLHIQDRTGKVPPTSTFAAAGIAISVVAVVTVALAARGAGTTWRASIALGGGFAAIAITKFAMGPTALYQGNRIDPIQNPGGVTSGGMVILISVVVGLLYLAAIWLLAAVFRPAPPPDGPSGIVAIGLGACAVAALIVTGIAAASAASQYIALALFFAAGLVAVAFRGTAVRARALGQASMYLSVMWVAIAFLLVFQVLWIVFLLAVVAIWPFKSVTPK